MRVEVTSAELGRRVEATATVRIHARRAKIWALLTSCSQAVKFVPGLRTCKVQKTAADGSWQQIRLVMDYSWYLPRVSYVVRVAYAQPARIAFAKAGGDAADLRGSWELQADGDATIAHYALDFEPDFWVAAWIARVELRRNLPKMLRALRALAELRQS